MPILRPRNLYLAFALLLAPALAPKLRAQPDSLLPRPAQRDTITVILGLRFPTGLPLLEDLRGAFYSLAQSIALEFRSPQPWRLPLWPGTYSVDTIPWLGSATAGIGIGAEGYFVFRLSSTGHVETAEFTAQRGAPGLGEALTQALHRADSLGLLPAPNLTGHALRDTTVVLEVGSTLQTILGLVPLAHLRVSALKATPPSIDRMRNPNYPRELAERGRSGGVIAQYVIDEKGHADLGTVEILLSDDWQFSRAAVEAIGKARFHPAVAHGIPVRFLVQQRFSFGAR